MVEPVLPSHLVEARRTPLFDIKSLPAALSKSHRTSVWAVLHVKSGSVRYVDLEGGAGRDERLQAGDGIVIVPGVEHKIEPSTDATFYIQFYREPEADVVAEVAATPVDHRRRSGPWEHRERDLDNPEEIFEMVTPQYRRRRPGRTPAAALRLRAGVHRLAGPHRFGQRRLVPCRPLRAGLRDRCHRELPAPGDGPAVPRPRGLATCGSLRVNLIQCADYRCLEAQSMHQGVAGMASRRPAVIVVPQDSQLP